MTTARRAFTLGFASVVAIVVVSALACASDPQPPPLPSPPASVWIRTDAVRGGYLEDPRPRKTPEDEPLDWVCMAMSRADSDWLAFEQRAPARPPSLWEQWFGGERSGIELVTGSETGYERTDRTREGAGGTWTEFRLLPREETLRRLRESRKPTDDRR